MFFGLLFATISCLLWGTIFIIPQFLPEFSTMEVALGRYFTYGVFSLTILTIAGPKKIMRKYPKAIWLKAFNFGLLANVIYYIGIVVGVRFATAAVTVLVVGLCPIFATIYGSRHEGAIPVRPFLLPCAAILFGIISVNITEVDWSFSILSFKEYVFGLFGALIAMFVWGWFAVHNAHFLKLNPAINRFEWTTMIGASTFFWVLILGLCCSFGSYKTIDFSTFFQKDMTRFFLLTGFLGVCCGWVGGYLWNKASSSVPISILGPFIIFETIFGISFAFLFEKELPCLSEILGISSMLFGIALCIFSFQKQAHHQA